MKVKLLVDTAYRGPLVRGDEIDVPADVAARWIKNRIAEGVEEEVNDAVPATEEETKEEEVVEDDEAKAEDVDYESMTAKELYALCTEKGIEVEPKQPKAYYIEKLA